MNDLRYNLIRERFSQLTREQLLSIVDNLDKILFDEFNFHEGKFCPMGIALGCHKWTNPTQDSVKTEIGKFFQPSNMLKGVPGEFYHGTDAERRSDLLSVCRELLNR